MTRDNTPAVMPTFKQIGATVIADPGQPVFAIDHDIQNTMPKNLEKYAKIEAFARASIVFSFQQLEHPAELLREGRDARAVLRKKIGGRFM